MCPIGGQHLSCCFRDLLIQRSLPAKLNCSLYLSGSCRSHPKRNWKQYFIPVQNLGGKQSASRCTNNKSMKLILFSPSHCFPWFFNIIDMYSGLPKNWHISKTYFNLKSAGQKTGYHLDYPYNDLFNTWINLPTYPGVPQAVAIILSSSSVFDNPKSLIIIFESSSGLKQ